MVSIQENHREIIRVQTLRQFSHYNAAKTFIEGWKILEMDPVHAEKIFETVVQIEPDNPYGWMYLLLAREDTGCLLSKLIMTCSKLIDVSTKKNIHGLDGLSKMMMKGYLKRAEEMGLKIR